jgi:hypothetical protein
MTDHDHTQTFWIEQFIYQVIVVLTKISIVLLYLRIFPKGVSSMFTYSCWAVIGFLIAYGIAMCIFFTMQCRPINYFWVSEQNPPPTPLHSVSDFLLGTMGRRTHRHLHQLQTRYLHRQRD